MTDFEKLDIMDLWKQVFTQDSNGNTAIRFSEETGFWKNPVDDVSSLPVSGGDGEARVVRGDGGYNIYIRDGDGWDSIVGAVDSIVAGSGIAVNQATGDVTVSADIDTDTGLEFSGGKIAINIDTGTLDFSSGEIKVKDNVYQPLNAKLTAIAGLTPASSLIIGDGLGSFTTVTPASFITDNSILTTSNSKTLTNKTIDLTDNSLSGTKAEFDTALSDDNFAYVGTENTFSGTQTFSSTITGSISGNAGTVSTIAGLAPNTATTQATQGSITTCSNLVTVGALNSGSITSGFGSINNGSSTITTTGALSCGSGTISASGPELYLRYPSAPTSSFRLKADSFQLQMAVNEGTDATPAWNNLLIFSGSANNIVIDRGTGSDSLYIGETADTGTTNFRGSGLTSFESSIAITKSTGIPLTITNAGTGDGLFIDQNGNGYALQIDSEMTTSIGAYIDVSNATSGIGLQVSTANATFSSGNGLVRAQISNAGATGRAIFIQNEGTGDGLFIDQNGNGIALNIDQDGNGIALNIDSEATTARIASLTSAHTTGEGLVIQADSVTSGYLEWLYSNSASLTGQMLKITCAHASNTGYGLVIEQNGTGNSKGIYLASSGTGDGVYIDQNGNGIALNIDHEGTSTNALKITSTADTAGAVDIRTTGDYYALYIERDVATATRALVRFNQTNATDNEDCLELTQDGTGKALLINQNGNGPALYIDSDATSQKLITLYTRTTHAQDMIYCGYDGDLQQGAINRGYGNKIFHAYRNLASSVTTDRVVWFENANAGDDTELFRLTNASPTPSLFVDQNGNIADNSSGASVHIDNTGNTGRALQVYSNMDGSSSATGLISFIADNTAFDSNVLYIQNDGINYSLNISSNTTTSTNFKRHIYLSGSTIRTSDGTTPNGNLSGTAGDICLNGPSGQTFYCTGTSSRTGM